MKKLASLALHTRLALIHNARTRVGSTATTTLTTIPKVVNHLLRTYAADKKIADTKDEMTTFT